MTIHESQRTGAAGQMRSTNITQGETAVDQRLAARSISVDQNRELLCSCVAEGHYTLDALSAATGVGRAYVDRVLKGDAPLRSEFEVTLPPTLLTEYRKRQAEARGLIVVEPLTGLAAQKAFVAGALGLLSSGLPAKANGMAHATIADRARAVNA